MIGSLEWEVGTGNLEMGSNGKKQVVRRSGSSHTKPHKGWNGLDVAGLGGVGWWGGTLCMYKSSRQ